MVRVGSVVAATCLSSIVLWTLGAAAQQPTSTDEAFAASLFEQGRDLLAAGNDAEACAKFEESERLVMAGGTLLNLAVCHERLRKTATAWAEFRQALALAQRDGRGDRAALAEAHMRELEAHLPKIVLVIPPDAGPDLRIDVDGTVVGPGAWASPLPLDPGGHAVAAWQPGKLPWSTVVQVAADAPAQTVSIPQLVDAPGQTGPAPASPASTAPQVTPNDEARPSIHGRSASALRVGAHLSGIAPSGKIATALGEYELSSVSAVGVGAGLDVGWRFARHFIASVAYEHAGYASNLSSGQVQDVSSHSDVFGGGLAYVLDPDRFTFYGQLGGQMRTYSFTVQNMPGETYGSAELLLAVGAWIPLGDAFTLLPLLSASFGSFGVPGDAVSTGPTGHGFFALTLAGSYELAL